MVTKNYTSFSLDPTLKRSEMTEQPEKRRWQPLRGPQRKPTISDYTELTKVCHKWEDQHPGDNLYNLYSPLTVSGVLGHIDEPQRQISSEGPRHLDIHRGKTPGTSGPLTLRLCCRTNYWFVWPEGELAPPTEPGFSQGFFSILSPMEFGFLAAVASGLLSWGHFISSDIIDLIAQILFKLNWAGQCHY